MKTVHLAQFSAGPAGTSQFRGWKGADLGPLHRFARWSEWLLPSTPERIGPADAMAKRDHD